MDVALEIAVRRTRELLHDGSRSLFSDEEISSVLEANGEHLDLLECRINSTSSLVIAPYHYLAYDVKWWDTSEEEAVELTPDSVNYALGEASFESAELTSVAVEGHRYKVWWSAADLLESLEGSGERLAEWTRGQVRVKFTTPGQLVTRYRSREYNLAPIRLQRTTRFGQGA